MTISICIPIFQQKAIELAKELSAQAFQLKELVEILIIDDGSGEDWGLKNQDLNTIAKVKFEILESNIGRSSIRNLLASKAKGEYLLFLDGDSHISKPDFLLTYCHSLPAKLVVGGRIYPEQVSGEYSLHWKYGRLRESKSAEIRKIKPHTNFHSNNFLIDKMLFQSILFEEKLNQYGHEDTLFGFRLEEHNIPIEHINNPVLHGTLETNQEFISKTELGLQNLLLLNSLVPEIKGKSSLLKLFLKTKKLGLHSFMMSLFRNQKVSLLKNLKSKNPSLKKFNLYKLYYLVSISRI